MNKIKPSVWQQPVSIKVIAEKHLEKIITLKSYI